MAGWMKKAARAAEKTKPGRYAADMPVPAPAYVRSTARADIAKARAVVRGAGKNRYDRSR